MGPEELGSVYESLLELVPQITEDGRAFAFATGGETQGQRAQDHGQLLHARQPRAGAARQRARAGRRTSTIAAHPDEPVEALLELSIVDPACGSGHFLLAAARRLAGARRAPAGERDALGGGVPPRAAAGRRPLHLRRRPEPDGGRAVQGEPVDGGGRARAAAHVPRLAHPARQRAARHDAGADGEGHPRRRVGADRGRRQEGRERAEEAEQGRGRRASATLARSGRARGDERGGGGCARGRGAGGRARRRRRRRSRGRSRSGTSILDSAEYRHQKFVADAWCAAFVWPKQAGLLADAAPTNELWRQIRDGQGDAARVDCEDGCGARQRVLRSSTGIWRSRMSSREAGSTWCLGIPRGMHQT